MSRLLDPKILMQIKNLSLAAKTTIDGFMAGINKSKVKGPGLEFSQYRSYQPGDDLRWLDWKMYARSDRYYIRESEIETSIAVRFIIDASASMKHKDEGFSKIEYARYVAASLAYLASQQGDSIGLYVLEDAQLFTLPAKKDHQHLARFYHQLESIQPGGKFTDPVNYKHIFSAADNRELVILITDFYQQHNEIFTLLENLSVLKHEIIVLHIMGSNELELNYQGFTALQDLETGQTISINTTADKTLYKQRLADYLSAIRNKLLGENIFYRMLNMQQPVDESLRDFLNQRTKLKA